MGIVFGGFEEELASIGMMMVGGCFGREGRFYPFGICKLESSVDLIGRDMIEKLPFIAFRLLFPVFAGGFEQRKRAHHVRAGEGEGVFYRAVHVTFGRQMDNTVNLVFSDYPPHRFDVGDISLYECIIRLILYILEICEIPGIRELVEIYNPIIGIFVYEQSHHMAAYKSGSAGY